MKELKSSMEPLNLCYFFRTMLDKPIIERIIDYRGPGIDNGIKILEEARKTYFLNTCV